MREQLRYLLAGNRAAVAALGLGYGIAYYGAHGGPHGHGHGYVVAVLVAVLVLHGVTRAIGFGFDCVRYCRRAAVRRDALDRLHGDAGGDWLGGGAAARGVVVRTSAARVIDGD